MTRCRQRHVDHQAAAVAGPGRASPPCARATDRTIDRPSPVPLRRADPVACSRRNGSNSAGDLVRRHHRAGVASPSSRRRPPVACRCATATQPPRDVVPDRVLAPGSAPAAPAAPGRRWSAPAPRSRSARRRGVGLGGDLLEHVVGDVGQVDRRRARSSACSERASISRPSISRSCRALTASSVSPSWRSSGGASGRPSATSSSVRLMASGVRSSCEALATNRRWPSNARSSRSSIASNVSASSLTSSCGPVSAIRSCRSAVGDPARGLGDLVQRPQRPAGDQPADADRRRPRRTPSAMPPWVSSELSACCWTSSWISSRTISSRRRCAAVGSPPGSRDRRPPTIVGAPAGRASPTTPIAPLRLRRGCCSHQHVGDAEQDQPGERGTAPP